MNYTFICHREASVDYPEVDLKYEVEGDGNTHMQLCEEFYFFLKGCGFIFPRNAIGIGIIEED